MDTLTKGLVDAVSEAMANGTTPQAMPPEQETVDTYYKYYSVVIPTSINAARTDPALLNSLPTSGIDASMQKLIDELVTASEEDDPDEIIKLKAYFGFMIPVHVNFIRLYPGIFKQISEYNPERIPQYVSAIVNALTANMFPSNMPVNPNDTAMLTWYYTIQIEAYVFYVRANPTIFNPIP
jgi:hypothetical protein